MMISVPQSAIPRTASYTVRQTVPSVVHAAMTENVNVLALHLRHLSSKVGSRRALYILLSLSATVTPATRFATRKVVSLAVSAWAAIVPAWKEQLRVSTVRSITSPRRSRSLSYPRILQLQQASNVVRQWITYPSLAFLFIVCFCFSLILSPLSFISRSLSLFQVIRYLLTMRR